MNETNEETKGEVNESMEETENQVFENKVETINYIIQNNEDTKDVVLQKEKTETKAEEITKDDVNENNKETTEGRHRANARSATLTI